MKLTELADSIVGVCQQQNIIYDPTVLPIKFGPDCYIIYGTPKDNQCVKHGECKYNTYYAMTGGDRIDIINRDDG